jgi:acetyltransferase
MAELEGSRIPAYRFPESAARALGVMWRHRQWMDRPAADGQTFEVDRESASRILEAAKSSGSEHLDLPDGFRLLEAYGIPTAAWSVVHSAAEAIAAAERLGGSVAMKPASNEILHKSDSGSVRIDLTGEQAVSDAYRDLEALLESTSPEAAEAGVLVQEMVTDGRETIIGMAWQPYFGPILMFGLGGLHVEVLEDVSFRIQPVTGPDAAEMLDSLRGSRILTGFRGTPPVARERVEEAIQRVSQLVGDHPEIIELDINPFLAFPEGDRCCAVDVRFRVRS